MRSLISKICCDRHAYVYTVRVQVLQRPGTVMLAGARRPESASSLQQLQSVYKDRLVLLQLDVTDQHSVQVGNLNCACPCGFAVCVISVRLPCS